VSPADRIRSLRRQGSHEAACELAVELVRSHSHDALLQYEAACVHDYLGREADAVGYYVAAIEAGLTGEPLRGAYLGLGSTYRALGRYAEALATLDEGVGKFSDAEALQVFRAMALYNAGRGKDAVAALLGVVARTSADADVRGYRAAIELYADDLDRRW
jgi:tetratricopeptide (TPR) repeat protein